MSLSDGVSETWLLGQRILDTGKADDAAARDAAVADFLDRFADIVWVTYRRNMPQLLATPKGETPDRSKDSAAFLQHRTQVVRLVLDHASDDCPFSFHHIVRAGARIDKAPGVWYGPNTVAQVLRELVSKHAAAAAVAAAPTSASASEKAGQGSPEMQLLVCGEGVVYKDQVAKACAGDGTGWQHSILLLAPLLLGLGKTIDETYLPSLLRMMRFPQSVGCIGGTPRHSLYFVGTKGDQLIHLDPHTVQPCAKAPAAPTTEFLPTYSCPKPGFMAANKIDPSLAVGFYVATEAEYDDLATRLRQIGEEGLPVVLDAQATTPAYMTDGLGDEALLGMLEMADGAPGAAATGDACGGGDTVGGGGAGGGAGAAASSGAGPAAAGASAGSGSGSSDSASQHQLAPDGSGHDSRHRKVSSSGDVDEEYIFL